MAEAGSEHEKIDLCYVHSQICVEASQIWIAGKQNFHCSAPAKRRFGMEGQNVKIRCSRN